MGEARVASVRDAVQDMLPAGWLLVDTKRCSMFWDSDHNAEQILVTLAKKGVFRAGKSAHCVFFLVPRSYAPTEQMLAQTGGPIAVTPCYQVYVWEWPYRYGWKTFSRDLIRALSCVEGATARMTGHHNAM